MQNRAREIKKKCNRKMHRENAKCLFKMRHMFYARGRNIIYRRKSG